LPYEDASLSSCARSNNVMFPYCCSTTPRSSHSLSFDEEPPQDIYFEGLTRTNATDGMVYLTFTPLKGMSDVVHAFIQESGQL
jgi:phage terminase large subunit-like protein